MPRSYSIMLPGRMSTPLIFITDALNQPVKMCAAPSDLRRSWQCKPLRAMAAFMKRHSIPILLAGPILLTGAAGPAFAQGAIGTVERGVYVCELPGDAGGVAGVAQPARNFTIEIGR